MGNTLADIFECDRLHCIFARSAVRVYQDKRVISAMAAHFEALYWRDLAEQLMQKLNADDWTAFTQIRHSVVSLP